MMLTLVSSNGFPSKLELAAVADHDGSPRSVFFVCRNSNDPRDDVFVTTDHPAEHHVFAWLAEGHTSELGRGSARVNKSECANGNMDGNEEGRRLNSIMLEKGRVRGITHHSGGGTASG